MGQEAHFIAELNALRSELLRYSNMVAKTTQHICSRYQRIINQMRSSGNANSPMLQEINEKVGGICAGLDQAAASSRYSNELDEIVQHSVMDLRMIIDIHLHVLDSGNASPE